MTTLAYFEGEIVPIAQANVSITCHTLHYGTGCFGGLRGYWNEARQQLYLFRPLDHYRRFLDSAKLLFCRLDDYTPEKLTAITLDLLRQEGWQQNCYIRPIAYKDDGIFRVWLHDATDKVAIFSQSVGKYLEADKGAKVCVSSWRRVDDAAMPARGKVNGTYVNSALAKSDAMLSGFDEAIVLNQDGHVSEASAANFMMLRHGQLITPPVTSNLLEGITRRTVLHLAAEELGLEVVERDIDRSELYIADEAFFCGTGVQIAAIGSIDHRQIGSGSTGPVTAQLSDLYFGVVTGKNEKYNRWLVPVFEK
ncbi:MAG: branched-chain amino acid transaminase [Anaerolineae bacterium]